MYFLLTTWWFQINSFVSRLLSLFGVGIHFNLALAPNTPKFGDLTHFSNFGLLTFIAVPFPYIRTRQKGLILFTGMSAVWTLKFSLHIFMVTRLINPLFTKNRKMRNFLISPYCVFLSRLKIGLYCIQRSRGPQKRLAAQTATGGSYRPHTTSYLRAREGERHVFRNMWCNLWVMFG